MTQTHDRTDLSAEEWAWAQTITNPGARIVLLCLARLAKGAWRCTPSQGELAELALISVSSVGRHLSQLEEDGHIARKHRYDENKKRIPDLIVIGPREDLHVNLETSSDLPTCQSDVKDGEDLHVNLPTSSDLQEQLPVNLTCSDLHVNLETSSDLPTCQSDVFRARFLIGTSPTEKYNPSPSEKGGVGGNDSATPKTKTRRKPADDEHPRFAEWYAAYPRKKDPLDASKAFNKAVKKVDPQVLIDAAKQHAIERRGKDPRYTKTPARWLNAGSWANEPDPQPNGNQSGNNGRPTSGPMATGGPYPVNDPEDVWK